MDNLYLFSTKRCRNKMSISLFSTLCCYSMEFNKEILKNDNININTINEINLNINNTKKSLNKISLNINNINSDNAKYSKENNKNKIIEKNNNTFNLNINLNINHIDDNDIIKIIEDEENEDDEEEKKLESIKEIIRRTNSDINKKIKDNKYRKNIPIGLKRYNSAYISDSYIFNKPISYKYNSLNIKKYNKYIILYDKNKSFDYFKKSPYKYLNVNTNKDFDGCSGKYYIVTNKNKELLFCKITNGDIFEDIILNEIKINQELSKNPNLITFKDVYVEKNVFIGQRSKNRYYLFSKYCEKGDLFNFIVKGKVNFFNIYNIMYDVINFVYTFHKNNYSHRDIKPENIFIDKKNNLYLGDFTFSTDLRVDDIACGSLNYASPELTSKKVYNCMKNDIFSLSVVLYILLFKQFPKKRRTIRNNFKNLKEEISEYNYNNISLEFVDDFIEFFDNTYFKREEKRWDIYDIMKSKLYNNILKKKQLKILTYKFK